MREIKFRFRSVGGMHKVEMINFKLNNVLLSDGDYRDIDSGILMQYTGIKDKNGKEIYEGDVIQIKKGKGKNILNKKTLITDIYYDKGAFRYRRADGSGSVVDFNSVRIVENYEDITQDVEIIGNIYENPELLQKT